MKTRAVQVLDEAGEDLLSAKAFYAQQEQWLGEYFVECALAELGSLRITVAYIEKLMAIIALYVSVSPTRFITKSLNQRSG